LDSLFLIATGAEGTVAGAGQADDPHAGVGPGALEAVDQLVDCLRAKRVHPLRPVDRHTGESAFDFVAHIGQLHASSSRRGYGRVTLLAPEPCEDAER